MIFLQALRIISLILVWFSVCTLGQKTSEVAVVHVRIVDHAGHDLGEATIKEFKSNSDDTNFANRFQHTEASGIPFGVYHLRAYATGFYTGERDVRVFQPDVWVTLGLDLGSVGGGPLLYKLTGTVRGHGSGKGPFWIRLSGVYSGVILDSVTDSNGNFAISGIPVGIYVLITSQTGHVLDLRPINVPASVPVLIDLVSDKSRG
jgi:hypothetical protein